MDRKDLSKTFLEKDQTLEEAIKVLHKSGLRIGLVVDKDLKLLGTVTDGDIRRALLSHKEMNCPVRDIMNSKPLTSTSKEKKEEILKKMQEKDILHMPITDLKGSLVDLETLHHLISKPRIENPVLIMAGGFGKRLMPLTDEMPKPMLKVGAKPILESILERFIEFGFHNFYISLHYKADMIQDYFRDGEKWGVSIEYVLEEEPLGTAGALSLLPKEIPNLPIILMNGDLVTELDFHSLLENHLKSKAKISVCVVEYDFQVPYGVIEAKNHKVERIIEKPTHKFFVNAGIYVINSKVIQSLNKNEYLDMPELLIRGINNSNGVNMFPLYEEWLDIGRMSELDRANKENNE